ncbi:hypothetical protein PaSha_17905 [Pseudonocardia alni]|nr:hypothetical protein PaSha_17905 [Pseudonocardia alni]
MLPTASTCGFGGQSTGVEKRPILDTLCCRRRLEGAGIASVQLLRARRLLATVHDELPRSGIPVPGEATLLAPVMRGLVGRNQRGKAGRAADGREWSPATRRRG